VLAGELLVDKLLQLVSGEEAQTQLMPTTLVVRKSCGS
jgi:alanine racemase